MLKVGFLDKQELKEHGESFIDALREHEKSLRGEVIDKAEGLTPLLAEFRADISELKKRLRSEKDDAEKADILEDIRLSEEEIVEFRSEIVLAKEALQEFKADKRGFLIEYVNTQVQR